MVFLKKVTVFSFKSHSNLINLSSSNTMIWTYKNVKKIKPSMVKESFSKFWLYFLKERFLESSQAFI